MFDYSKKKSFLSRAFTSLERLIKVSLFDCSMCGQCIVRSTGLACVMRCPKQLRNGPCGGTVNGMCEVDPGMPCAWIRAYDRAHKLGRGFDKKLDLIQPPVDWRLWGTSSWESIAKGTIDLDGNPMDGKLSLPMFPASGVAPRGKSPARRHLRPLGALGALFRP